MAQSIAVGIDVGTFQVKVSVAVKNGDGTTPRLLGVGFAEARAMRHGYTTNPGETAESIKIAVSEAEKASGIKIKRAVVGLGGIGLGSVSGVGTIATSRADSEITDIDIEKAIQASESSLPATALTNRKIINRIPLQYKIDGRVVWGEPKGLKGGKIEVKTLFITFFEHHMSSILEAVDEAGIEVDDVLASPLAASIVTLNRQQKIAGVVLANIGSETISIVVFENGSPLSLEVFPIGGSKITSDIALGLRIPLEEAEEVKRGNVIGGNYPSKKLEEIIEARLSDIFELVEAHLKKIGRSGLLPAGIIVTGGGSAIESLCNFAKQSLRLPARVCNTVFSDNGKSMTKDATWAVSYGLAINALSNDDSSYLGSLHSIRKAGNGIAGWFRQFLP